MKPRTTPQWDEYRYATKIEAEMLLDGVEAVFEGTGELKDALCDAEHGGPVHIDGILGAARRTHSRLAQILTLAVAIEKTPHIPYPDWKRWKRSVTETSTPRSPQGTEHDE